MLLVLASADVDMMRTGHGSKVAAGTQIGMLDVSVVTATVQVAKFGRPSLASGTQIVAVPIGVERTEMAASRLSAQIAVIAVIAVQFLKFS